MLIFLILIFQKYNIMITEDKKKMQLKQAKKNVNQKKKKKIQYSYSSTKWQVLATVPTCLATCTFTL